MDTEKCRKCGGSEFEYRPGVSGHYRGRQCVSCRDFVWLPKPDALKARRPAGHRELARKHGRGFCEMCGILESRIPGSESLHGHHVVPYCGDGGRERGNVWVVCSRCHRLHWARTYIGHLVPGGCYAVDEDPEGPEEP